MINGNILELGTLCSQLMNEMLQVVAHVRVTGDPDERVSSEKAVSVSRWLGLWRNTAKTFEWPAAEYFVLESYAPPDGN